MLVQEQRDLSVPCFNPSHFPGSKAKPASTRVPSPATAVLVPDGISQSPRKALAPRCSQGTAQRRARTDQAFRLTPRETFRTGLSPGHSWKRALDCRGEPALGD